MRFHLKVKVFTLQAEMSYIRRQEEKWKNRAKHARAWQKKQTDEGKKAIAALEGIVAENTFKSLREHRDNMKRDARVTHLAFGAMKGRPYSQMEILCYGKAHGSTEPNWSRIEATVARFSRHDADAQGAMQRFAEWLEAAKDWYKGNPDRIKAAIALRKELRERQAHDAAYQAEKKARAAAYEVQKRVRRTIS